MHVVIGVITAIAGLIWALVALQRAGVNLGGLDPIAWYRRMKWNKKYAEKPIYCLQSPMDVAALLLLGTAKCEGVISAEQKKALLDIFVTEFRLGADEASDLLLASSHLLRDEVYLVDNLAKILERSGDRFTTEQIESTIALMRRVASLEGEPNEEQAKLIGAVSQYFEKRTARRPGSWS